MRIQVARLIPGTDHAGLVLTPASTGNFYVAHFFAEGIAVYGFFGADLPSFDAPGLVGSQAIVFAPNRMMYVSDENADIILALDPFYLTGRTSTLVTLLAMDLSTS